MYWLRVPYEEKNEAKALGARWDPSARKWFVPDGMDPETFERWRPCPGTDTGIPVSITDRAESSGNQPQSLSSFLERVQNALRQGLPGQHWVVAEVASMKAGRN